MRRSETYKFDSNDEIEIDAEYDGSVDKEGNRDNDFSIELASRKGEIVLYLEMDRPMLEFFRSQIDDALSRPVRLRDGSIVQT